MQPTIASGFEQNGKVLYVGNLNPRVNEAILWEVFSAVGGVETLKIIRDKGTGETMNYGFVDFVDNGSAMRALTQLNGVDVYGSKIKVNWAIQGGTMGSGGGKEDTASMNHLFVGDLSADVTEAALKDAFKNYTSLVDGRIMYDKETGKSRGYAFLVFRNKEDADSAIREMNGVWLGQKAIRVNWANQKPVTGTTGRRADVESIMAQTTPYNTTVYVGNLAPEVTEAALRQEFTAVGPVTDIKMTDKGFAFVHFTTHENAARAILVNNGLQMGQKQIRCSWGKDKNAPGGMPPMPGFPPYGAAPPAYGGGYGAYPPQQQQWGAYQQPPPAYGAAPGYGAQAAYAPQAYQQPAAPAYGAYNPAQAYAQPAQAAQQWSGYPAAGYPPK